MGGFVLLDLSPSNGGPIPPQPHSGASISLAPGSLLLMLELTTLPITFGLCNINKGNKASGWRVILKVGNERREK